MQTRRASARGASWRPPCLRCTRMSCGTLAATRSALFGGCERRSIRAFNARDRQRESPAYDRLSGLDHAIDVVTVDGAPLVLDNQVQDVTPAAGNERYQPYYALNDRGWWAYDLSESDALPSEANFAGSGFRLARY
jgi:hypothetical protein